MAGQEETLPGGCEQTPPGVTPTDSLMATRSPPRLAEPPRPESRSTELMSPSSTRLDREHIGRDRSRGGIRSLYLQQNQIEKIENLGCFPNLWFLCLAGNRIQRVENLQPLQDLRVLDLSHNHIQTLDPEELPRSLRRLDLTGNGCTRQRGYRELVVGALPHLLQLDTHPVRGRQEEEEEEEEGGGSSSSEDEDEELLSELSGPFTAGKDFFVDLQRELAGRARRRRREVLQEHRARLEELRERRGLLLPPTPRGHGAPGRSQLCPQGIQLPPLGRSHPKPKALPGATKGARTRLLPPIPRTGTAPRGGD